MFPWQLAEIKVYVLLNVYFVLFFFVLFFYNNPGEYYKHVQKLTFS